MDGSGEAVERVVRISMDGAEHALRIAGNGAKALGELLAALLKEENRTRGAMQLRNMIRTGKELKVFTLSGEQFKQFKADVKDFGVTYCALRNKESGKDGLMEIMVKAEDASKVHRIFERNGFGSVDASHLESDIEKSRKGQGRAAPEREESAEPSQRDEAAPSRKDKEGPENPLAEKASGSPRRSEDISGGRGREGWANTTKEAGKKKSVRIEIMEIKKARAGKSQAEIDAAEYVGEHIKRIGGRKNEKAR